MTGNGMDMPGSEQGLCLRRACRCGGVLVRAAGGFCALLAELEREVPLVRLRPRLGAEQPPRRARPGELPNEDGGGCRRHGAQNAAEDGGDEDREGDAGAARKRSAGGRWADAHAVLRRRQPWPCADGQRTWGNVPFRCLQL